jgi:hypothetical protein
MGEFTPWAICFGVFAIYPAIAFVVGFYIGKKGLPVDVQIRRRRGWWLAGGDSLTDDGYGVVTDS